MDEEKPDSMIPLPWTEFQNLEVGDTFILLNRLPDEDDNFSRFVKLRFNKARNVDTGEVHHFSDLSGVWTHE
jgi:hypothetical protein